MIIVRVQCVNFFFNGVLCCMEKWGKAANKVSHWFGPDNLFMKGDSLYLWRPPEVITVANKHGIRFIKLMQFGLYFIQLILHIHPLIQIKHLITTVKCFMLQWKIKLFPQLRNIFKQVEWMLGEQVWLFD